MSESLVFLSELQIRSIFRKKRAIAQKTDERIPSPAYLMVECSTQEFSIIWIFKVSALKEYHCNSLVGKVRVHLQ